MIDICRYNIWISLIVVLLVLELSCKASSKAQTWLSPKPLADHAKNDNDKFGGVLKKTASINDRSRNSDDVSSLRKLNRAKTTIDSAKVKVVLDIAPEESSFQDKTNEIILYSLEKISDTSHNLFTTVDKDGQKILTYYGLMLAGAIARSVAATTVHPLNVIKTMLQTKNGKMPDIKWSVLTRGAGAQFAMSIPHGAINFVVTETTKLELSRLVKDSSLHTYLSKGFINSILDFFASAISTLICSIVSTPQMVITDRIMAGVYGNFFSAVANIYKLDGIGGFYLGWLPAVAQKIPSYSLTWMFFQQLKNLFIAVFSRPGTSLENTFLGSLAAAGACCIMMPLDTVKTRIVTQDRNKHVYKNMWHCIVVMLRDEGIQSFYKALPPRLLSVVPMIGIQFAVYELIKRLLLGLPPPKKMKAMMMKNMQTNISSKQNPRNEIKFLDIKPINKAKERSQEVVRKSK